MSEPDLNRGPMPPADRNPDFDAWVASLPAKSWARYDLSACRLGWEAGVAFEKKRVQDSPREPHCVVCGQYADGMVIDTFPPIHYCQTHQPGGKFKRPLD